METSLLSRIKRGWNAFQNGSTPTYGDRGLGQGLRPDRVRYSRGNEKSIITAVYNRIGTDVAALDFRHVLLDESGRFSDEMDSGLNHCLSLEANLDQTGRALIYDIVASMFDEGVVGVVPVETDINPNDTDYYKICELRTGRILEWYPQKVRILVYNEDTGRKEELILPKQMVAIIENPFFAVMNEPNSTAARLVRKLNLLDVIDEQSSAGKLDMIIGLPYVIKTEARREQAERRRKDIENQLSGSKYGIAYTDGTEKITQLNRPLNNNLMSQIEYLTEMLYSQLGITKAVMDGTADEQTLLNYNNQTIEPIASAIVLEFRRKFLTKTGRSQGQSVLYFRDPFRLVPVGSMADIADKFTRNEVLTSNEIRQIIGFKPSSDPKADQLINSNLNHPEGEQESGGEERNQNDQEV